MKKKPELPALGVNEWVNAAGDEISPLEISDLGDGFKIIFCFQHACPGCHLTGFPTLSKLIQALKNENTQFVAVQTAFEDFEENNHDAMLEDQARYALPIPFGHDNGDGGGSFLMRNFGTRGTPWFIVIAPDNEIVFSDFRLHADGLIAAIREYNANHQQKSGSAWANVVKLAKEGNPEPPRRDNRTEAQWRAVLSAEQFRVMRNKGTERAHSSEMCSIFAPGIYACAGCETPLFNSTSKFESGTGWPSFTTPIAPNVLAYHQDRTHGMTRIETTCNVCDAHLGHVFPDGPAPTGLRFCINAVSLRKNSAG